MKVFIVILACLSIFLQALRLIDAPSVYYGVSSNAIAAWILVIALVLLYKD